MTVQLMRLGWKDASRHANRRNGKLAAGTFAAARPSRLPRKRTLSKNSQTYASGVLDFTMKLMSRPSVQVREPI